jgi:hypothetical protein
MDIQVKDSRKIVSELEGIDGILANGGEKKPVRFQEVAERIDSFSG